ncbi:MAG TPA: bifunctional UDP-N-acetylglucosamine diphosphorylase/glucosamine-1-phosphate N-acetyltransferase GlmU [Mycobacteriales bacterium]|nr:bifunctional UDP-N-acetylglucosamine diphosphorylase/glucosamine-1-phosphate N-acetyltransferase GlmU [Mycobacteriales bacterium]
MTDARPAAVVVLAAGEGTRMKSATTPKVLHPLAGRTMVGHVVTAARALDPEHLVVVVGHARERVIEHVAEVDPGAVAVVQEQQNGTGHAVRVALEGLGELTGTVVVVPGDAPLLTGETLQQLVRAHQQHAAATTLLTARMADPTGYGRVVRDDAGAVRAVVEHKDADEATRAIDEVAVSVYAFDAARLREALGRLSTDNAQGEEYLTDVVGLHVDAGLIVAAHTATDAAETMGVNDRAQLAEARRLLNARLVRAAMLAGVTVVDPQTTWLDVDVHLDADVEVRPGCQLLGGTRVAAGATIGPDTTLLATEVGRGASVVRTQAERAVIGPEASVGPFTYLRPGTVLGRGAKAGAYVEIKASEVGEGSKVPHLSYVGDATIGVGSNIGAATVFVNYDGRDKHRTTVGDDVRVGSDTMLVAPVTIGDGAYTAAGSVITDDVPPGALGVGRAKQRNIEGWVARRRGPRDGETS